MSTTQHTTRPTRATICTCAPSMLVMVTPPKNPPIIHQGNAAGVFNRAAEEFEAIVALQAQRKGINNQIGSVRENIERPGLCPMAIKHALQLNRKTPEFRRWYDQTIVNLRAALDMAVRSDLPEQPSLPFE